MEIKINNLEHSYQKNTPFERRALFQINTTIPEQQYTAIIGHTGSGKSTLLQHLNVLLKPTSGSIKIGDYTITATDKVKDIKKLRKKVGIVFQFPEHQLFEETVEKDICFGPMNFGIPEKEAKKKAREALKLVGLEEKYLDYSPFDLSGGQMRRVAIAGVLAMEPDVIVLDEPTAGLDPRGREEIMELFYTLHKEKKLTTILVTHSMEDAAKYADQIIVLSKGTIHLQGEPTSIFKQYKNLQELGLDVPETVKFVKMLEEKLGDTTNRVALTLDDAVESVLALLKERDSDVK